MRYSVRNFFILVLVIFGAQGILYTQSYSEDKKRSKKVSLENTINELLRADEIEKLKDFQDFDKALMEKVSDETVLSLYKKYRSDLLSDASKSENENGKWSRHTGEIIGLFDLAKATKAKSFYQQVEKDIERIELASLNNLRGWPALYLKANCATVIFAELLDRYGAKK